MDHKILAEWLFYLIDMNEDVARHKDPERALSFWVDAFISIESCSEADQLFPEMIKCPVCMAEMDLETLSVDHKPVVWL